MEQPAGADHVAPDPAAATGGGRGAFPLILALGIAAVFAAILLGTIDFPARTHADELSKVQARYAELFGRPYLEISNGRPSFAFFNPVFRIVALDGDAAHLQRLAGELRAKHPNLSMTLVNVRLP
jgi:hypothetical protein